MSIWTEGRKLVPVPASERFNRNRTQTPGTRPESSADAKTGERADSEQERRARSGVLTYRETPETRVWWNGARRPHSSFQKNRDLTLLSARATGFASGSAGNCACAPGRVGGLRVGGGPGGGVGAVKGRVSDAPAGGGGVSGVTSLREPGLTSLTPHSPLEESGLFLFFADRLRVSILNPLNVSGVLWSQATCRIRDARATCIGSGALRRFT